MKIKVMDDYIMIAREPGEKEKDFIDIFNAETITLMVGKSSRKVNGIKIWKSKIKAIESANNQNKRNIT